MRQHYHNVQALRGIACLFVVVYHLEVWDAAFGANTLILHWFQWFGFAGVDLFFVLSGFVIASTNRDNLGRPAALGRYLRRRFWRIYPTYWAAMLVSAAIAEAVLGKHHFDSTSLTAWPWWLSLAPGGPANSVVDQSWTLIFEVMFYLAFGILLLVPRPLGRILLCSWGAAVAVAVTQRPALEDPLGAHPLNPFVLEFLGGCLIAGMAERGWRGWWRPALGLGIAYAVVAVLLAATASDPGPYGIVVTKYRVAMFGPSAVLILYGFVAAEGVFPRRVPGWLLWIGDASYSLYLSHWSVLLVAVAVGLHLPHTRGPHLLWLAGTMAATIAVGLLFHAVVEKRLLGLSGRPRAETAAALPSGEKTAIPAAA